MGDPVESKERLRRPSVVVVSAAIDLVLRGLGSVYRNRVLTPERADELVASEVPTVLLVWHHQLLMLVASGPALLLSRGLRPPAVLISRSKDGDYGHRLAASRGLGVVRGSSSRGGAPALRQLVRELKVEKRSVAVVPDGPRGPSRRVKEGALTLAAVAGAPIVPLAFVASSGWRLRSWDRTIVPKPFARVGVAVGSRFDVPRRSTSDERRDQMLALDRSLDELETEGLALLRR